MLCILTKTTSPVKSLGGSGSIHLNILRILRKMDSNVLITNSMLRKSQMVNEEYGILEPAIAISSFMGCITLKGKRN